jgi:hypothetical protein
MVSVGVIDWMLTNCIESSRLKAIDLIGGIVADKRLAAENCAYAGARGLFKTRGAPYVREILNGSLLGGLGDVNVEEADRIGLEPRLWLLVALDIRQPPDPMPLQTAVQRRAGQAGDCRLKRVKAVVERQQRMAPEGDDDRLLLDQIPLRVGKIEQESGDENLKIPSVRIDHPIFAHHKPARDGQWAARGVTEGLPRRRTEVA